MKTINLLIFCGLASIYIFLGVVLSDVLFPWHYSMCPPNDNHLWFMLMWMIFPALSILIWIYPAQSG